MDELLAVMMHFAVGISSGLSERGLGGYYYFCGVGFLFHSSLSIHMKFIICNMVSAVHTAATERSSKRAGRRRQT